LLFFERIHTGDYIIINIKDKSLQEIISTIRELFTYIRKHKKKPPFSALRSFKRSEILQISIKTLYRNLFEFGRDNVLELLRSLWATPS
jgi:uncharacterized protein YjgD (DUF1641 family)